MHDVGELEVFLRQERGARGKEPAQVLEYKLARACAWDLEPVMVLPVKRLDEIRELLTLFLRYRKNLGDDDAAALVSSTTCRRNARVRCVKDQVLAVLGQYSGSQGLRREGRSTVRDLDGSISRRRRWGSSFRAIRGQRRR
jgi:hypothetical protein